MRDKRGIAVNSVAGWYVDMLDDEHRDNFIGPFETSQQAFGLTKDAIDSFIKPRRRA
jgi:hypothetical protein